MLCYHEEYISLSDKLIHMWTDKNRYSSQQEVLHEFYISADVCVYVCGTEETACTPTPVL